MVTLGRKTLLKIRKQNYILNYTEHKLVIWKYFLFLYVMKWSFSKLKLFVLSDIRKHEDQSQIPPNNPGEGSLQWNLWPPKISYYDGVHIFLMMNHHKDPSTSKGLRPLRCGQTNPNCSRMHETQTVVKRCVKAPPFSGWRLEKRRKMNRVCHDFTKALRWTWFWLSLVSGLCKVALRMDRTSPRTRVEPDTRVQNKDFGI